jgi:hypothetical protein
MCVTVYKYLVWPNLKSGSIPIGTTTQDYPNGVLLNSGFEIYNQSALKFPAVDINEGQIKAEGLMYYSNTLKKWRCCIKKSDGSLDWVDCGGGGSPFELKIPLLIKNQSGGAALIIDEAP